MVSSFILSLKITEKYNMINREKVGKGKKEIARN